MLTRLFCKFSLMLLIAFATVITGCGETNVEVKETVSTPASESNDEECCGGCCGECEATSETSASAKKECCENCTKGKEGAVKECCGKCKKDSADSELVSTDAKACEYCKEGKACAECQKQKAETVSTEAEK